MNFVLQVSHSLNNFDLELPPEELEVVVLSLVLKIEEYSISLFILGILLLALFLAALGIFLDPLPFLANWVSNFSLVLFWLLFPLEFEFSKLSSINPFKI